MLTQERTNILIELIKDDFYLFDYCFCLKIFEKNIKNEYLDIDIDNQGMK